MANILFYLILLLSLVLLVQFLKQEYYNITPGNFLYFNFDYGTYVAHIYAKWGWPKGLYFENAKNNPIVVIVGGAGFTDYEGSAFMMTYPAVVPFTYTYLSDNLNKEGVSTLRYNKRYVERSWTTQNESATQVANTTF